MTGPANLSAMTGLRLPGEAALRAERSALLGSLTALPVDDFESGATLCAGWSPRDVLAHVMSLDHFAGTFLRHGPRLADANAVAVAAGRRQHRDHLLEQAHRWATHPAPVARGLALVLLGDLATHHQDVTYARGDRSDPSRAAARAVLREGVTLGGRRLLTHRVIPTDGVAPAVGRGRPVRGRTVALGLWLAGRREAASELDIG